jgi:excisionase family DNA binding protein
MLRGLLDEELGEHNTKSEYRMTGLMTLEEVADYLHVTRKTVYRLLKAGKMPATRVGRQWRFNRAAVNRWLGERPIRVRARLLVIDDEETIQALFKETLEEFGHAVETTGDSAAGLLLAKQQDFDMVFLDLKMPGIDGAEVFRRIRAIKPNLPVTIITGYPESDLMAQALAQGPFGVMKKPFTGSDIITATKNFLRLANTGKKI